MSEAPSWLNEDNANTAVKVAKNPAAQKIAKNPAVQTAVKDAVLNNNSNSNSNNWTQDVEAPNNYNSSNTSDLVIDEARLKDLQRHHLILRILYMSTAVFLGLGAGLSLQNQKNLGVIFFAFYVLFFSLLICCFEVALNMGARFIAVNFGFMYTLGGRAIFLLLVGFMSFSLGIVGQIAMAWLYFVGCIHIYIMCKFPEFESYLRKKHYYEGKRDPNNQ